MFIVARILHGIQFAFIGSLNLVLAADFLPKEKMGSGLGFFGVGGAIATAIGPTIGISISDWGNALYGGNMGYKIVFLISAFTMLISILPCALMPYKRESKEELATLGKWYQNIIAKESIFPAILMLLVSMASILYTTYMKQFAQERGIENIGLYFTVYAIVLLAARPLCGKLLDRYGVKKIFLPASACFILSFIVVGSARSLGVAFIGAALAAIGYGATQPSIQTLCVSCVNPIRRGAASNTNYFGLDLGYFLGPVLGGQIIAASGNYDTVFFWGIIPVALAILIFFLGWNKFKGYLK
jgi:MFS family permease